MRFLWGFPGWGWKMYGLMGKHAIWFLGFSKQHKQDTLMSADDFRELLNRKRTRESAN